LVSGHEPGNSAEDTYEPLAVHAGIIDGRLDELRQVVFEAGGDERQSLAAFALLTIHANKRDDIGMVKLAPCQAFDAYPLRGPVSQRMAERATTYLVQNLLLSWTFVHTEAFYNNASNTPRPGPCTFVHVGEGAEPGGDERVVLHTSEVVAIWNLLAVHREVYEQSNRVSTLGGKLDRPGSRVQPLIRSAAP
jgi:hypothetical protein